MDLQNLLGSDFECACGKRHHVPVRMFAYEHGVLEALPSIIKEHTAVPNVRRISMVADERTWQVCGEKVHCVLEKDGLETHTVIVPDKESSGPICDDITCEWLKAQIGDLVPHVLVAVGSGTINDLCKWSCFDLNIPYVAVATAASMNGYAAANVAATIAGVKVLIEARPPVAVIAEPDVIESAPSEMTAAGFGDTIAKYQSNADWILNNILLGEYYCRFCADILNGLEDLYIKQPELIMKGDSEAIEGLFAALFWTGIAMTLVGTSAPASGGEHLLSHTLDMIADMRGKGHDLHGRQVGVGTIFSAALYERLLNIDRPKFAELPERVDEDFWGVPTVVEAVKQQYLAKRPQLLIMRDRIAQQSIWQQAKESLRATVKSPKEIKNLLLRAGAASSIAEIGRSQDQVRVAAMHMHEIRKRCTVVDLAWVLGVLPGAVDEIINEWLN
jgi:glycerol-1-phosphate dehydrogenase [NAD(P)+]